MASYSSSSRKEIIYNLSTLCGLPGLMEGDEGCFEGTTRIACDRLPVPNGPSTRQGYPGDVAILKVPLDPSHFCELSMRHRLYLFGITGAAFCSGDATQAIPEVGEGSPVGGAAYEGEEFLLLEFLHLRRGEGHRY